MPNVLLTQQGMDFILSAHNAGVFIDLEYFVPVYDDRIDPTIRDSSVLSANSDIADASLTTPIGEIIWNQTGYSLDSSSRFIISANAYSSPLMQNSYQNSVTLTNLHNSAALSNQISASSWSVSGGSLSGLYNWEGTGNPVTGSNSRPYNTSADFWKCSDYYPVYDTSATGALRGSFKCVIENTKGTFKFNKIALYAVAYQDGIATSDVAFFGEAYLGTPAVVSNMAVGYDRFEYDIQIEVSGVSASFEDIFFSSSADYWAHSPGGLYWPGMIGVGEFVDNQKVISATIHARKARNTSGTVDVNIPILQLDYDNTRYVKIDVDGNRYDVTKLYTGQLSGTDVVIKVANWTKYCGNAISIHPDVKATVALGTSTKPFRELYLENSDLEEDATRNRDSIIPLSVINKKNNYAATFNSGSILVGLYRSVTTKDTNWFGMKLSAVGLEITDDLEALSNKGLLGNFKGGDLWREGQNLLVFNTWCSTRSAPNQGVEKIYIFAGLDGDSSYTSIDGQSGATHKNIIYEIEQANPGLFCGQNSKLANLAELHLAAKGKIGLHGPVEIQNLSEYADSTSLANAIFISRSPELRMLIGAGFNSSATFNDMSVRMRDTETMIDLISSASSLFLVAGTVYTDANFLPTKDSAPITIDLGILGTLTVGIDGFDLGSSDKRFRNLFVRTIGNGEKYVDSLYIRDIYAIPHVGGSMTASHIGTVDDPFYQGYFTNLYVTDGYFTNLNVDTLIQCNSITANSVSATNGFFERNRTRGMGRLRSSVHTVSSPTTAAGDFKTLTINTGVTSINSSNSLGKLSLAVIGAGGIISNFYSSINYSKVGDTVHMYGFVFFNLGTNTYIQYIRIGELSVPMFIGGSCYYTVNDSQRFEMDINSNSTEYFEIRPTTWSSNGYLTNRNLGPTAGNPSIKVYFSTTFIDISNKLD